MFEDIAPNMNIQASDITRGKFLGKGTFGSVFRGELKQTSGDSLTIAMKMPLNNEVGDEARPEEVQMAAAAMRALKENPTMALNDAYRWENAFYFASIYFNVYYFKKHDSFVRFTLSNVWLFRIDCEYWEYWEY